MILHKDRDIPKNGEVFVFGSNESGMHGAGAAKEAYENFGAEWGIGSGMSGGSYAIATKDKVINTLPLEKIKEYVNIFIQYVLNNPDKMFFVTRIGCGFAGYSDSDIAPMFLPLVWSSEYKNNCSFAKEWETYLTVIEEPKGWT